MHFDYLEEHEILRDATRGFLERDDPIALIRAANSEDGPRRRKAWERAAAQGWAALLAPADHGGSEGSVVEAMVVAEELGRAAFTGPFLASNAAAWALSSLGTPEQKAELLEPLAAGDLIFTWGAYVQGRPWDGSEPGLTARKTAVGYAVSGQASFVQDADIADYMLVSATAEEGLQLLCVPLHADRVSVRAAQTIDLTRRFCEVTLSDVEVPLNLRLGDAATSGEALAGQFRIALVLTSADSVGAAARLHDMTLTYTKERIAFGKPIASFQALKHRMADMLVLVETARVSVWQAAIRTRDGDPGCDEAASIAKFYATDAASRVAAESMQLHGGIGFTWEHDLHLFHKRAKANEMIWGPNPWHRERVARMLQV